MASESTVPISGCFQSPLVPSAVFAESQIGAGPIPRVRCAATLKGLTMAGATEGRGVGSQV